MSTQSPPAEGLPPLVNLARLRDLIGVLVAGDWLTVAQVESLMLAAGYHDSGYTLRRMIDGGAFGPQGEAWYRTEIGNYRMVHRSAVEALIARRKAGPPAEPPTA